jgi:hypothetical protein
MKDRRQTGAQRAINEPIVDSLESGLTKRCLDNCGDVRDRERERERERERDSLRKAGDMPMSRFYVYKLISCSLLLADLDGYFKSGRLTISPVILER